ncbi:putative membrane protein [Clostridioides difficile CD160]|nr:putative membrane protein [Clostridioides difficile CD160]
MNQTQKRKLEFIKNHWDLTAIEKERNIAHIIRYTLTTLAVIAFFLPTKIKFSIHIFVSLFCWIMYLLLYPKMPMEMPKKRNLRKYYIPFPFTACVLSIMLLLLSTNLLYTSTKEKFSFVFIYMIILFVPYVLMLISKKIRETKFIILLVLFSTFILSFSTTPALNYIATLDNPKTEFVKVIDKVSISSRSGKEHYFKIEVGNEIKRMKVSNKMYKSTNKNKLVQLCKGKSIFGYEYWTLQN